MADKYGFPQSVWDQAKSEIRTVLAGRAQAQERGLIPYSTLVGLVQTIQFEPHDARLFDMLGEISRQEDSEGRGMLSVIVVHKQGDMRPGPGFFDLAEELGRNVSDIDKCWLEELRRVWRYWAGQSA